MTLKKKLESLEGLSDEMKKLYKEVDGTYILDLEGDDGGDNKDQLTALKKKKDELLDELKDIKRKAKEAEDAKTKDAEDKAKAKGDFESLLKSAQEKIDVLQTERNDMVKKNHSQLIDQHVMSLSNKLCDGHNVEIMKSCIQNRLKVNTEGKVVVLDKSGGETVFSQDDLVTSIQKDPMYASIIRGTQSKGGGATGGSTSGASSDDSNKPNTLERLGDYHEKQHGGPGVK